ncbi:MAG: hypothetical protein WA840_24605 [Caulobacteraceae bacterium]
MLADSPTRPGDADRCLGQLDNARLLEDLQSSGLLAEGRAHVISIETVRTALGRRWHERKAVVWDMVEALARKRLDERDLTARISEDAFLLLTPQLEPGGAKVLATRIAREVLTHFLGQLSTRDIVVMVARQFVDGVLECTQMSSSEILGALAVEAQEPQPAGRPPESAGPGWISQDDCGALTTLQGRRLRFSVSVDPIIDLARWAVAGHRIEPKITFDTLEPLSPEARQELLPRDLKESDLATLRRGLSRLEAGESSSRRPSLILTVSFQTLSNSRTRLGLLSQAVQQRAEMTSSVIWEITDLDAGVPLGALRQAVTFLKPFCRSVFVRADGPLHAVLSPMKLGLAGFVLQFPSTCTSQEDQALWLLEMSRTLKTSGGTLIAANLATIELLPLANAAGFTHATVRV